MDESFGSLLGEFLDKAVIAFDSLSVATEQFIDKSVAGHFVNPHSADNERLKKFGLSLTDILIDNEKSAKSKPEKKKEDKKSEEIQIEEKTEKLEVPAQPAEVNDSQETKHRRKKHHRRHSEDQDEKEKQE